MGLPDQDLLLAVLVEREPIKLAPNSAQIPALLAETKQNIFHLKPPQPPAQQQQPPPPPAANGSAAPATDAPAPGAQLALPAPGDAAAAAASGGAAEVQPKQEPGVAQQVCSLSRCSVQCVSIVMLCRAKWLRKLQGGV